MCCILAYFNFLGNRNVLVVVILGFLLLFLACLALNHKVFGHHQHGNTFLAALQ